jgi:tetratricopeptide (TPR) repeat protein/tRNA A-37 threonylcarbamoyl transferase component Bud32
MPHPTSRRSGDRFGPYELVHPLGRGGMGEVWEAVLHGPAGFRKRVAVKLLRHDRLADPRIQAELLREARLGALLAHPNIVGTLGLAHHDDTWVVALELVVGATAWEVLRKVGPLPPRAVLEIGVQLAQGLAHAHDHGLVHRDVKPANVLLDRSGLVRLADLGISLAVGEQGGIAGTPGYAAPEQLAGRPEPASDLFGLAVTLAVLALGRPLFGTGADALRMTADPDERLAEPGFLAPLEAALPGSTDLFGSCLRSDPGLRPRSARHLVERLVALRGSQTDGPSLMTLLARARPEVAGATPHHAPDPSRTGNVQRRTDRFVGRERELAALLELAPGDVACLVGPGGAGKSRLAEEFAWRLQAAAPGGAFVADLGEAREREAVYRVLAKVLGVSLGDEPERQLGRRLADLGEAVLVLDGVEGCDSVIRELFAAWPTPRLRVVTTARRAPRLPRERVSVVGELSAQEAAALVKDRTGLGEELDGAELTELCGALDRLPLALELAAARIRLLGVAAVRKRLSLGLLADRAAGRSLESVLDGSVSMLSAGARTALADLSVFVGGFTLDAAEAVVGDGRALAHIEELSEASLLRVEAGIGRFRLWAMVREYAPRLAGPGALEAAEARHGAWFAQFGDPVAVEQLSGPTGPARTRALAPDLDNLVVACRRALAARDGARAVATLRAAMALLARTGPLTASEALAKEVAAVALGPVEHPVALRLWAEAAETLGRYDEAVAAIWRALMLVRHTGDQAEEAQLYALLGYVESSARRVGPAQHALSTALSLSRKLGLRRVESAALARLGALEHRAGHLPEARALLERALAVARDDSDRRQEGLVVFLLANLEADADRLDDALQHQRDAARLLGEAGELRVATIALMNVANVYLRRREFSLAEPAYQSALAASRRVGDRVTEMKVCANLGNLTELLGRADDAVRWVNQALETGRDLADVRTAHPKAFLARCLASAGRAEESLAASADALAEAEASNLPRLAAMVLGNRATPLLQLGRLAEADACLLEATARSLAVDARAHLPAWAGTRGQVAEAAGRLAEADTLYGSAAALAGELHVPSQASFFRALRARLAFRQGSPDAVSSFLAEGEALRDHGDPVTFAWWELGAAEAAARAGDRAPAGKVLDRSAPYAQHPLVAEARAALIALVA